MSEKEKHVSWIIKESKKRGYTEFAREIEGVLQAEGFEAAYNYIAINAEVQKMLFFSRGEGGMSV